MIISFHFRLRLHDDPHRRAPADCGPYLTLYHRLRMDGIENLPPIRRLCLQRITRAKSGIGALVAGTSVPVVPCHIHGAFRALPPGRCVPFPRSITLRIGQPLRFEAVVNERIGWELIAGMIRSAIESLP